MFLNLYRILLYLPFESLLLVNKLLVYNTDGAITVFIIKSRIIQIHGLDRQMYAISLLERRPQQIIIVQAGSGPYFG